jgi:hypothetical protein
MHVMLLVLQAPLPSSERVAWGVEAVMDLGKRNLTRAAREAYYYVQVCIDAPNDLVLHTNAVHI